MTENGGTREAEQIQIARAIGQDLSDIFVAYVRGRIGFDALTFGVYDAMSDLHAVASGDYELAPDDDAHDDDHHGHHHHDHHDHGSEYDDEEATEEQEELSQEPARDAGE